MGGAPSASRGRASDQGKLKSLRPTVQRTAKYVHFSAVLVMLSVHFLTALSRLNGGRPISLFAPVDGRLASNDYNVI